MKRPLLNEEQRMSVRLNTEIGQIYLLDIALYKMCRNVMRALTREREMLLEQGLTYKTKEQFDELKKKSKKVRSKHEPGYPNNVCKNHD